MPAKNDTDDIPSLFQLFVELTIALAILMLIVFVVLELLVRLL